MSLGYIYASFFVTLLVVLRIMVMISIIVPVFIGRLKDVDEMLLAARVRCRVRKQNFAAHYYSFTLTVL